jgi:hypothetical protein
VDVRAPTAVYFELHVRMQYRRSSVEFVLVVPAIRQRDAKYNTDSTTALSADSSVVVNTMIQSVADVWGDLDL